MSIDYKDCSKKILDAVGGKDNISSATNCMTRLRLILKDESKADDKLVSSIKGVKGVMKQGGIYQIVIGNEVSNLFKEFKKLGNFEQEGTSNVKAEGNIFSRLFGFIAGCMTPLLPAMLGTGMIKVLLTLLTTSGVLSTDSSTYILLFSLADCFFYFLPVYMAYIGAKKIGGTPVLFMTIACALVYPNLIALYGSSGLGTFIGMPATSIFGIPVITASYTSSVLPILLMLPVMKYIEDFADRVSPNVLKAFLKPMIFLLICFPIAICVLGPLGNVLGQFLSKGINALYNSCSWLAIAVLSALMPFIVMSGMHYALIPLCTMALADPNIGYDALLIITMFCSNIAQGGAAFGVALKTKNTDTKSEGIACGISATIAGVTEPAMYGINIRYKKPMIAACIAAGISGFIAGLVKLVAYSMGGSPSFLSIITFIGGNTPMKGVIFGVIIGLLSLIISFVLSFMLYKDENEALNKDVKNDTKAFEKGNAILYAPIKGEAIDIKDVPDDAFNTKMLGDGIAIIPSEGKIYAPCDGKVSAMMPTKHAIGIISNDGIELLIHIGIDTVKMEGRGFDYKVKENDNVKKGELIMTMDLDMIKSEGYNIHTPIVITNTDDCKEIKALHLGNVEVGDEILSIKK